MITALLFSVVSALTSATAGADDGWLAWSGCWRAEQDAPANMLCIVSTTTGARLLTLVNGKVQQENEVIADGVDRAIAQEGCSGMQRARWSEDGQRLFMTSRMSCGTKIERRLSSIMSMQSSTEWLSVQAVSTTGTAPAARVIRYHAVEDGMPEAIAAELRTNKLARETARYAAVALLDLTDVQEAVKNVDEQVVAQWLTETRQQFDLSGKKLVALADAGVPASVIDVLVAVSHPERFAVRTASTAGTSERDERFPRRTRPFDSCYDTFYDPWSGPMSYYSYTHCYGYSRYGSLWGYDTYGWNTWRTPIIVVRGSGTGTADKAKVTRRGYTSGRSDGESAVGRERTTSTTGTSTTRSTGSSSSGGSSSGSSSSGRTAKPRDN